MNRPRNYELYYIQKQQQLELERRQNIQNVLLLSLLIINRKKQKKRKTKRFWVRDIFKNRRQQGVYHNLLNEMRLTDTEKYFNYLRMPSETFNQLLNIVGPKLTKLYCVREPISSGERLALTLRYLASGDSMVSISYAFRVASNTVSNIIHETCNVIWDSLNEKVLLKPNEESWQDVANDFEKKWQLPHCVGAIDGKHVVIQAPAQSGSTFYNYKGSHSIVLLALCDANYKFTMVDIGGEGRHSDGGIFKHSNIGKHVLENKMKFPAPSALIEGEDPINYFIAADEAFPLSTCIMRPYPGRFLSPIKRIFNYRLCRARRVIENVFGILAARWRIYRKTIIASQPTVMAIVKATVCLHNFIINSESKQGVKKQYYTPSSIDREDDMGNVIEGEWRNEPNLNLLPVRRTSTNMYGRVAENMRERFSKYFMEDGAVPFQWDK